MKLLHLSDLHLGKRIFEQSMLEDQRFILDKILKTIDAEKPDAVIIAGDIYDKAVASAEAVVLFDRFLWELSERKQQVLIISGNHDSPERLAFGGRIMAAGGIHISPVYNGEMMKISFPDAWGTVNIWLMPFVKPTNVRAAFPEEHIETYTDAMSVAIRHAGIDTSCRNVLVTHQFVTGAETSESEERSVGGSDNVDVSVFEPFDYVALGHIHGPQNVCSPKIRYCGTPLKYSFSEANHQKSVTVAELGQKGSLNIRTLPLAPLHEMRELCGTYDELLCREFYSGTTYSEDYLHITLTDENDVPDAVAKLRTVYKNLLKLDYDNIRTRHRADFSVAAETEKRTPLENFAEFYKAQNGVPLTAEQANLVSGLIEKIWEDQTV